MAGPIGAQPGRPKCWDHLVGIPLLVKWPGQGSEGIKSLDCVLNSSQHSSSFSQRWKVPSTQHTVQSISQ